MMSAPTLRAAAPAPAAAAVPESISVRVIGHPVGQGNIDFLGGHGVHANAKTLKPWRGAISAAVQAKARTHRFLARPGTPKLCAVCRREKKTHGLYDGAVSVHFRVYVPYPASYTKRQRLLSLLPITRSSQDTDHHARAILDALTDASVYNDDAQVVDLVGSKRFAPQLELPGAEITVRPYRPADPQLGLGFDDPAGVGTANIADALGELLEGKLTGEDRAAFRTVAGDVDGALDAAYRQGASDAVAAVLEHTVGVRWNRGQLASTVAESTVQDPQAWLAATFPTP
jgi:Holliday junction resolvase RusA-like endonuclease